MVQTNIYLDEQIEEILKHYSDKWKIKKYETIRQIILRFRENPDG